MKRSQTSPVRATAEAVARAATLLREGGLVAFPTETVYGLGADASNLDAVKKIFAAKGRPAEHPLIVHLADASQLERWAKTVPDAAHQLAEAFLPGPLTLIFQRSERVPDVVTGGQDTVGLRIPSHEVALNLLKAFDNGIAAPSANRFGRISPTQAAHVAEELGDSVDLILDGGACEVGLESTILDLSSDITKVLRPGGVRLDAIAEVLGYMPEVVTTSKVRASGTLESHYAPTTPSFLVSAQQVDNLARTASKDTGFVSQRLKPAWVKGEWQALPAEAKAYGQALYTALRELDEAGLERIYVEAVPDSPEWLAVRDRLRRATTDRVEVSAADLESR